MVVVYIIYTRAIVDSIQASVSARMIDKYYLEKIRYSPHAQSTPRALISAYTTTDLHWWHGVDRGYHVYKKIWTLILEKCLCCSKK